MAGRAGEERCYRHILSREQEHCVTSYKAQKSFHHKDPTSDLKSVEAGKAWHRVRKGELGQHRRGISQNPQALLQAQSVPWTQLSVVWILPLVQSIFCLFKRQREVFHPAFIPQMLTTARAGLKPGTWNVTDVCDRDPDWRQHLLPPGLCVTGSQMGNVVAKFNLVFRCRRRGSQRWLNKPVSSLKRLIYNLFIDFWHIIICICRLPHDILIHIYILLCSIKVNVSSQIFNLSSWWKIKKSLSFLKNRDI